MKPHPASLTPEQLATKLADLFSQRGRRWLPDIYFDAGKLLIGQLPADSQHFPYSKHTLIDTGEALKQKCDTVGTPSLRWAVRLVRTIITEQQFDAFRACEPRWTTVKLVLRALPPGFKDPERRMALICQQLKAYDPTAFVKYVRKLIPSERVRKLKAGEKAFVVVTSENRLRGKYLLNEEDAARVAHRYMKKGVRIIPVVRYGLT